VTEHWCGCKEHLSNDFCNSNTQGQGRPTAYTVIIEEHIAHEFSVEACDIYQAMQIAEERYHQGLFVVQSSTPNARLVMARDNETGEMTEWREF